MIYKLKVLSNSIELVRLVSSPENDEIKEIRIANSELGFRFNRILISSNEFFDEFVDKISTLLEPFLADITELKISLRSNFFNIHSIPLDNLSRIDFDTTYLNWEVNQYITNSCNEFLYGYIHNTSERKTVIIIVRKKIHEYFERVFTSINGSIEQWSIGYDYLNNKNYIFVASRRRILPVYIDNKKSLVAKTGDRIKKFKITNVVKLLASVFLLLFIIIAFYNRELIVHKTLTLLNLEQLFLEEDANTNLVILRENKTEMLESNELKDEDLNSLDNNNEFKDKNLGHIDKTKIIKKKNRKKSKDLYFNFIYDKMIDRSEFDFLVLGKESSLLKFNFTKDAIVFISKLKQRNNKDSDRMKLIGSNKDILSVDLEGYNNKINNDLTNRSKMYYNTLLESFKPKIKNKEVVAFTSKSELLDFIEKVFTEKFYFNKLKISIRNDKFYMVVDFD